MSLSAKYIQYGVPSNWAEEYDQNGISVSTFKQTSKKNLIEKYNISKEQIDLVKNCLNRQPIDEKIIQKLLENSGFTCCLCKGRKGHAYIIHHIIEYSLTQNNAYSNLAVLCPNDHDLAHRGNGISLTNKILPKQIKEAKQNWEKEVKEANSKKAIDKSKPGKIDDWKKINPYKELNSFTEGDKEYFFGRNDEVEELLKRIYKYNIVGLFGESGTGKTSLVNAGLIPNFKDDAFIIISVRCLDEPIKRIREELFKKLKENKIPDLIIEELATTDTFSRLLVKIKSLVNKESRNLIIIIDQFEEIFTRAREAERVDLAKGIIETLASPSLKGKLYFLLSLREDFIGDLWDWAHLYKLEDAWINQFRIKRLRKEKAFEAIIEPLQKIGIKAEAKFINQLLDELIKIGDDLIYPPYLQIVCSQLFEHFKIQNSNPKPLIEFGKNLYKKNDSAESIIAEYLSESMMEGLTEQEKNYAQNILDLLTGAEGLRTFLKTDEISKYLGLDQSNTKHVIEHLIKKKIVHPIVDGDTVTGYELVHDFLSKKFFEKLDPEAKRTKTTIEIFRKAFREWEQHGVLASKDRLEILFPNINQLNLQDNEWKFLIKSSFSVYWYFENKWATSIDQERLTNICISLLDDKEERIVENAIGSLGKIKNKAITPTLIKIIESPQYSVPVKDTAIHQFSFNLTDFRIINILRKIIKTEKNNKLRKTAVYAFGKNISEYAKSDPSIIDKEIECIFEALNDSMTQVRKQAADVLSYVVISDKSIGPLIERLQKETSILSRKAVVSALCSLLRNGKGESLIYPILKKISSDQKEDYRVREEAKFYATVGIP